MFRKVCCESNPVPQAIASPQKSLHAAFGGDDFEVVPGFLFPPAGADLDLPKLLRRPFPGACPQPGLGGHHKTGRRRYGGLQHRSLIEPIEGQDPKPAQDCRENPMHLLKPRVRLQRAKNLQTGKCEHGQGAKDARRPESGYEEQHRAEPRRSIWILFTGGFSAGIAGTSALLKPGGLSFGARGFYHLPRGKAGHDFRGIDVGLPDASGDRGARVHAGMPYFWQRSQ